MKLYRVAVMGIGVLACGLIFAGCGSAQPKEVYVNQFDVAEVTDFAYVAGDQMLMFDKTEGVWTNLAEPAVELDAEKVDAFLEEMSQMKAVEVIEEADDYAQYGVTQPTQLFAVVFSDRTSLTYCFGVENGEAGYYLQVNSDAEGANNAPVYTVDSSVLEDALSTPADAFGK